MPTRKKNTRYEELFDDADAALRALSRRFPEALARTVLGPDERIASAEWLETQVAMPQVRMDRVLQVDLVEGQQRLIHGEWTDRLTHQVERRMGEYHLSVAMAERVDAEAAEKLGQGGRERRRVESTVVILRGRKKPWPEVGTYPTTPDEKQFGGAWFYIDAVYQRTVAELDARGSPFWLAFVPLARDVDEDKLRQIVERLRNDVSREDFDELVAAMLSMAKLKKDSQRLMDVIMSASAKERPMHPFMREGLEQGMEKGLKQGRIEGLLEGRIEGQTKGLAQGLAALVRVFERRLGRAMTERERRRIAKRMSKDGPEKLGDVVVDLSAEQLVAWLAPRKTKRT